MGSRNKPAQKKRKNSGRQPLEVDGSRRQIGLDLHVGEAAPDGARARAKSLLHRGSLRSASGDAGRAADPLQSIFRDGDEPAAEPDSHG